MTDEERMLAENFIDLKLVGVYRLDGVEGVPDMARQVRLVVGEGEEKTEVGIAEVEKLANGDAMVTVNISNSALIKALGGGQIKGVIPNFTEPEEPS